MDDLDLANYLNELVPVEIADLIDKANAEERIIIINSLSPEIATEVFENLSFPLQKQFLDILPSESGAKVLNALSPDDRTAFLEELPDQVLKELLKLLSYKERELTLKLLGYPEYSVGRLMTTDYITVKPEWTVSQVLEYVRKYGHYSETISVIFVIDAKGVLIDDIDLRDFLFASPDAKVSSISDGKFIALNVTDAEETAISVFQKYSQQVLPVVNNKGVLLGIVTADDILTLMQDEDTEDMQKAGGLEALDAPYMHTPFFELMQKRAGWLVILFLGEMFTATAMGFYEEEISKAVVLALFLPLIISSGGNSGSQASSLIIRALAIKEITLKDWWKIMRREIYAGLFLGAILGIIGYFRITLWSLFTDMYGPHSHLLALTVGISLIGVVLWGTFSGSMFPLILKYFKFDPATASAPLVATIVDVTGVIIYFSIAYIILQGTLL